MMGQLMNKVIMLFLVIVDEIFVRVLTAVSAVTIVKVLLTIFAAKLEGRLALFWLLRH